VDDDGARRTHESGDFGEIMLRLAPPAFQRFRQARSFDVLYGGGEANVAVSLANYGEAAES
jgi:2-dehydro-3-deoxygluconokinase